MFRNRSLLLQELRGVAVLVVVAYHFDKDLVPAGWLGVDAFFLLSGYLITKKLNALESFDMRSAASFLWGRIRRLMPSLLIVLAIVLVFAWFTTDDATFRRLSFIGLLSPVGLQNFYFAVEDSYFLGGGVETALNHTWSLAVEDQWYLLVTLMFLSARQWLSRLFVVVAVTVTSLSLAVVNWNEIPDQVFYLAPFRFFELGLGALLAFAVPHLLSSRLAGYKWKTWLVRLLMTPVLIASFSQSTWSPLGLNLGTTLLATAAVILVSELIEAQRQARLSGQNPLVLLGDISYALYLVHMPVLVFSAYWQLDGSGFLIAALLGLLLAASITKFIENPIRVRSRRKPWRQLSLVTICLLVIPATAATASLRFTLEGQPINTLEAQLEINRGLNDSCDTFSLGLAECQFGTEPGVLLWGDSHAMHIAQMLSTTEYVSSRGLFQATRSVCAPLLGVAFNDSDKYGSDWGAKCIAMNEAVFEDYVKRGSFETIFLASPFYQLDARQPLLLSNGQIGSGEREGRHALLTTLQRLVELDKDVVLVVSPPQTLEPERNIGQCLFKKKLTNGELSDCDFALNQAIRPEFLDDRDLLEKISELGVKVLDLADFVCVDGTCRASVNGTFIYRDHGHLSKVGSAILAPNMEDWIFNNLLSMSGS